MSELQISLLVIGIIVVLAVYGYGAWQQLRHRRRFGSMLKHGHEDALYHGTSGKLADGGKSADGKHVDTANAQPAAGAEGGQMVERRRWARDCSLLDEATDYIAVLTLATPAGADALAQMWQKRFDFGKTVNACGLKATTGEWEKIMAESHIFYTSFKLALQLADRSGAVSELRLADFREMAKGIALELQAEAILPEVPLAVAQARQLDEFCAEVDQMIGLNILPGGDRLLSGGDVAQVAEHYGLSLQADGAFHLMDERGYTLFSLSNFDNAPFRPHTMKQMPVIGLSMQLDVPRVDQPAQRFDEMALLAKEIGRELQADVVDDHRMALSDAAIAMIRAQVAALEDRMLAYPIVPGSAQARRLFS